MRASFVHSTLVRWLGAGSLAVGLSLLIVWAIHADLLWKDFGAGWALAALNAAAAFAMNRRAVRAAPRRFILYGVVANLLRLAALVAIIFLLALLEGGLSTPFLVAVMTGYFVFQFAEVLGLYVRGTGNGGPS